ncbi:hypothetical protein TRVL_02549 [Trypanosoma vivax]|nr:hypothetical protein TRVL_02549 [Trypanosoma vivax]
MQKEAHTSERAWERAASHTPGTVGVNSSIVSYMMVFYTLKQLTRVQLSSKEKYLRDVRVRWLGNTGMDPDIVRWLPSAGGVSEQVRPLPEKLSSDVHRGESYTYPQR